jgi:serine/threonine-protein kinase
LIGSTLSHFEITAELGAGGMGTVYRGRDTKLGREVAIKVLPEVFTADAERLARFEREAKVLASLNHPSIAGVFEVGHAVPVSSRASEASRGISDPGDPSASLADARSARDDSAEGEPTDGSSAVHYLVMELAEGEDLAERLVQGPMSVDEALPIARQIAEALEAAHKSGVIHRDLKPANVKLLPDGGVKVLDFGLAKAFDSGMGGAIKGDLSHSPTLTAQMTSAGMILGTAAYMSPEQAKGEEADRRSDIWSFGIVLWEMLVGRKTFAEDTVSETLAAVLKSDPDHSVLPTTVPLSVRRLIERCLQKDPEQRLHDIADARLEIEAVLRGDDSAAMVAEAAPAASGSKLWKGIAVAASIVALASLASHFVPREAPSTTGRQSIRFAVDRPPLFLDGAGPSIALSPDGRRIAYRAKNEAGNDQIFLRSLDAVEATPVPGTEGGLAPFFSPDGSRIGYTDVLNIYTVALHGGAPSHLTEVRNFRGAVWADDDFILYSPGTESGLWRIRPDGNDAERITVPDIEKGERSHRWPAALPGGDIVLFTVGTAEISAFDEAHIDALRISTGERKTVVESGMFPVFIPPDKLLYAFSGSLMAVRLDVETLTPVGSPIPVLDGLATDPLAGVAAVAVSDDGSLASGLGQPLLGRRQLVTYDRDGRAEPLSGELAPYQAVALSPDGSTLAVDVDAANAAIWLIDLERDIHTRLTTRWSHNVPVWSPDGADLISSTSSGGTHLIYRHQLASGESEIIHRSTESQLFVTDWSVDGNLAVDVIPIGQGYDVWTMRVEDPSQAQPVAAGPATESSAKFSPDGRWVAFVSDESGRPEIYVIPSTGSGAKTRVSATGGSAPFWSQAGNEIYFYDGRSIVAASFENGERLRIGRPEALFQPARAIYNDGLATFDVTRDGRFILFEFIEDPSAALSDFVFTRHWADELERLLAPQ